MLEESAAARTDSKARQPIEARRPWPEIALPVAVVVALLLDLMSDAHWGNLRLHPPLEVAAAAVALAAATASWLRCARAIARSHPARAGVLVPRRVCEGTPHIDSLLWTATEFAMRRDPIAAFAAVASIPSGFAAAGEAAIPCPAARSPVPKPLLLGKPLQIEGALVVRRRTNLSSPDPQVRTEG